MTESTRETAVCATADPELWFPLRYRGAEARRARALCATCPASAACLEYALTHGEDWGIWGGTDPDERRAIRGRYVRPRRSA